MQREPVGTGVIDGISRLIPVICMTRVDARTTSGTGISLIVAQLAQF